jgi:hypothetical protein
MRWSKLTQHKFSKNLVQLGLKNLMFLNYRYDLLLCENISLIVGNIRSKFEPIWSKITPKLTQKLNHA